MALINFFANPDSYTPGYYTTILDAAAAIASPFLVQQKYQTFPGVNVSGTQVAYNGTLFNVSTNYINPSPDYYIQAPDAFLNVWPKPRIDYFPNAAYDPTTNTFNAFIDCVGYGSRVLIATGSDDPAQNALRLFESQVNPDAAHFSAPGWVPMAFEFAVALPVLRPGRWSYVCGSVYVPGIQKQESDKVYNGAAKGGFSGAQAGDIVCMAYEQAESNGHFMVLTQAPQPVSLSLFQNLDSRVANAYRISVYDSTASGSSLHFNDSRRTDNDTDSGVGYGELYFFTNNSDEPIGFIFGPAAGGMEPPHYLYDPNVAQTSKLEVMAITLGRFQ